MEHIDPRFHGRAWKADQGPAGVGRRVETLGHAWDLRWHRLGQSTKRDNLRGVVERQQGWHQAFDVAPDTRRG